MVQTMSHFVSDSLTLAMQSSFFPKFDVLRIVITSILLSLAALAYMKRDV